MMQPADHAFPGAFMPRLKNKVVLITGASGGQGMAEAHLFTQEGAAVVLTDRHANSGCEFRHVDRLVRSVGLYTSKNAEFINVGEE